MRILHVASSYPLTDTDSTAPFMAEMLEAQVERSHEVSILVPRLEGLVAGNRNGVKVIGVPYAPSFLQVWGYGRSLHGESRLRAAAVASTPLALGAMAGALRRTVDKLSPDIVHLHWVLPLGVLGLMLRSDIPVVLSAHGADARFASGRLRPLARLALGRADAVVAASSRILDALSEVHPAAIAKARVIPHGANAALFHPRPRVDARSRLGIPLENPVVLAVGRLVPKKGFDTLINVMPKLESALAQLYLVGEGPERSRLESMVPTSLADRIHFVGPGNRGEVADWYSASDVVAIPGRSARGDIDTGPVVLVEAFASGRPVVATRIGMAPDVIRNGENGLLVDSTEPATLAHALNTALTHSDEWGVKARRSFEAIGSWDRVASDLECAYTAVLKGSS